ncbi:tetraspanin-9-like [Mytilus trossulus]|uniref:tetraspanin-9-like n=1 Tax=Mytilus trossulus TaxID=6551 RepID=UPI00300575B7
MGCLLTVGRIFCVIVNLLFLIIGLILFALGMIVKFGDSLLKSYYQPILDNLEKSLNDAGYGNITLDFSLSDIVGNLALAFILTGLFLLILTIFGLGGACCKVKCMLIIYVVMLSVVLAGQIVFIIIFYAKQELVTEKIKDNLKPAIQTDFQGLNGTNVVSLSWNFVNQQAKCCGVDSYRDFTGASQWIINYPGPHVLQTPLSCCKDLPTGTDFSCASAPTDATNYWKTSCFDELWDKVIGNVAITATVLAVGAVIQLIMIIVEFVLFMDVRKNKVDMKG